MFSSASKMVEAAEREGSVAGRVNHYDDTATLMTLELRWANTPLPWLENLFNKKFEAF